MTIGYEMYETKVQWKACNELSSSQRIQLDYVLNWDLNQMEKGGYNKNKSV
jgi:hypothetical protein